MPTLTDIRKAVASTAGDVSGIKTAMHYRPPQFPTSPFLYVEQPNWERTRMGAGAGAKPVTVELKLVCVVSASWTRDAQETLDTLSSSIVDAFDTNRGLGLDDTSAYIASVNAITAPDGVEVATVYVGAVFTFQIETKI